jgi:hypothetical protein
MLLAEESLYYWSSIEEGFLALLGKTRKERFCGEFIGRVNIHRNNSSDAIVQRGEEINADCRKIRVWKAELESWIGLQPGLTATI